MGSEVSIAMNVKDNMSLALVGIKNSMTDFRHDVKALGNELDHLNATKVTMKVELDQAKRSCADAKKAFLALGESATEAERQAAKADWSKAEENLESLKQQYDAVGRQIRRTTKDMEEAAGLASRNNNHAGGGESGFLASLGKAGLIDMAGDVLGDWAGALAGSSMGGEAGSIFSSGLSGAMSGAALGSIATPIGAAVGAAIGGVLGLASGGSQAMQARDDAFKTYYTGLYDEQQTQQQEAGERGKATAAQRELDAIAFSRLLEGEDSHSFLSDLRDTAARTPLEYSDLTVMSRALATGFGDDPKRMLDLMTAIGDAGSAVGVTAQDMGTMAQSMSRMQSSGKASLEYLNIFQERGVDVIGMLSDGLGKSKDQIYGMISKGDINGRDAVNIIQAGMVSMYGGAMDEMSKTFSGLTSTLADAMTEIESGYGDGFNAVRKTGIDWELSTYDGPLGDSLKNMQKIAGENQAYLDNLQNQYHIEAQSAVLLGQDTTLYDDKAAESLQEQRKRYMDASTRYEATGDKKAALEMQSALDVAEGIATAAFEVSDQYKAVQKAEEESLTALRNNTTALEAATGAYSLAQERDKGFLAGYASEALKGYVPMHNSNPQRSAGYEPAAVSSVGGNPQRPTSTKGYTSPAISSKRSGTLSESAFSSRATGLNRVPYNDFPALLHEGERVLTAQETRAMDDGASNQPIIHITVSNNTFGAGMDAEGVAQAMADVAVKKLLAGFRG